MLSWSEVPREVLEKMEGIGATGLSQQAGLCKNGFAPEQCARRWQSN
jgi:hypothetical protein